MNHDFYMALEDEFRGGREEIKNRLTAYLPFVNGLKDVCASVKAIDIGCGRGEWLELLSEQKVEAIGVDVNDSMIAFCKGLNLNVVHDDVLSYLRRLVDESVGIISGFHIAEHLSFETLRSVISEAKRVLMPGGILILETPNPENITVGTSSFYIDPTHNKPIPPQLISFLTRFEGFERNKILRLQEANGVLDDVSVFTILTGVSPDYAVIAQKKCLENTSKQLDSLFNVEVGVTLIELAEKYEEKNNKALHYVVSKLKEAEGSLNELSGEIIRLNNSITQAKDVCQRLETELHEMASKFEHSEKK